MHKLGFLILVFVLLATQCIARSTNERDVVEVPFSILKGLVIVDAKIKGNVPVKVALATGIEHSITDMTILEKHKLTAYYTADGPVTGRNDKTYTFTMVNGVSVGSSKSKDLSMRLGAMSQISGLVGQEIFATLGADFFEGQIIQFDFKSSVVRFIDKQPAKTGNLSQNLNASKSTVLRMMPKASDPFRRTYLLPAVRDVQFNGQKGTLLIDTGIATSLAFSSSAAKKLGLPLPTENGQSREERVNLRFESSEISDVPASIYAKGTSADQTLSKYGVVAGSLFLQKFIATFDFQKGLVVLE